VSLVEEPADVRAADRLHADPGLEFTLDRHGGELVLDVAGPEDARPVIEMFFAPEPA
jgi:hypothetical protein